MRGQGGGGKKVLRNCQKIVDICYLVDYIMDEKASVAAGGGRNGTISAPSTQLQKTQSVRGGIKLFLWIFFRKSLFFISICDIFEGGELLWGKRWSLGLSVLTN